MELKLVSIIERAIEIRKVGVVVEHKDGYEITEKAIFVISNFEQSLDIKI